MYYKMSNGNKIIHNMATANFFISKQVKSLFVCLFLVVFNPFGVSALGILLQENRNKTSRNICL